MTEKRIHTIVLTKDGSFTDKQDQVSVQIHSFDNLYEVYIFIDHVATIVELLNILIYCVFVWIGILCSTKGNNSFEIKLKKVQGESACTYL